MAGWPGGQVDWGVGAPIVKRSHEAIVAAFATPEAKEAMAKQGNTINISTPDAAALHFKNELVQYAAIVKRAGVQSARQPIGSFMECREEI